MSAKNMIHFISKSSQLITTIQSHDVILFSLLLRLSGPYSFAEL